MNQHQRTFLEEAAELLDELQEALLELEADPDSRELVDRVFRALHTIKGSGRMFGFERLASFTHELESVFDHVREGGMQVSKALIDLTLKGGDQIRRLLDSSSLKDGLEKAPGAADQESMRDEECAEIISGLRDLVTDGPGPDSGRAESSPPPTTPGKDRTYRIRFRPHSDIFLSGTNPILLLKELEELGDCIVVGQMGGVPSLELIEPEACYTFWDIILTTGQGPDAIEGVFIFVEDRCSLRIDIVDESGSLDDEVSYKKLGEILVERQDLTPEDIEKILAKRMRIGELLTQEETVEEGLVQSALTEQNRIRDLRRKRQSTQAGSTLRVQAERLDRLVDLTGELVTVQARLTRTATELDHPELSQIAEDVERLIAELRDNTMGIRMLPIGTTFGQFRRLVRDLGNELGKEVVLTTEGGETELDKTMIERLNDPLIHIIRNSVDHGVESPETRKRLGKAPQGKVRLSAEHSGSHVLIHVEDDGAGLDPKAIKAKAVAKGIISEGVELSEKEAFSLIMLPGFSTAKNVTDVSGRGVGMDVVKRNVEDLRGTVEIESRLGVGSRFTLRLPLTLAIIEGLLVQVTDQYFVLPLSSVERCVELTTKELARSHGREIINVRDEFVPYVNLREQFQLEGEAPDIQQVVITEIDSQRIGFVVDQVIGQHQTVIKTLGRVYRNAEDFSGGTILADGTVALILDLPSLASKAAAESHEPSRCLA